MAYDAQLHSPKVMKEKESECFHDSRRLQVLLMKMALTINNDGHAFVPKNKVLLLKLVKLC